MKKCPECGSTLFLVTAHVTQGWVVDGDGEWLATSTECEEITHAPDDDDIWTCSNCGYSDAGYVFNKE